MPTSISCVPSQLKWILPRKQVTETFWFEMSLRETINGLENAIVLPQVEVTNRLQRGQCLHYPCSCRHRSNRHYWCRYLVPVELQKSWKEWKRKRMILVKHLSIFEYSKKKMFPLQTTVIEDLFSKSSKSFFIYYKILADL